MIAARFTNLTKEVAGSFSLMEDLKLFNVPMCKEPGCNNPGQLCVLPGGLNLKTKQQEPDFREYFCSAHKRENGYCDGCGEYMADFAIGDFCLKCLDLMDAPPTFDEF